jgi:hypothetical protein
MAMPRSAHHKACAKSYEYDQACHQHDSDQGGREDISGPVQQCFQVGMHEVPIDGVGLALQELAEHLDRPELVDRKITQPDQVI